MRYPKGQPQKKRQLHGKSILQDDVDKTCYLCRKLYDLQRERSDLEVHHIFNGNPDRRISEAEGFTVRLCPGHHRTGPEAAHRNIEIKRLLQQDAQRAYERTHSRAEFMALLHRNYLEY